MVHKILANTSVKEVRESGSSVRAHSNKICLNAVGKVQDAFFDVYVIIYV